MSTLPHLVTPHLTPRQPFGSLSHGAIIDEAKVLKIDSERGVLFKLGDNVKGLAYVSTCTLSAQIIQIFDIYLFIE